jgi:hypothetical protein
MLLMAKDASLNVNGLDEALTKMSEDRKRTTTLRYESVQMMKHMAAAN